MWNNTDGKIEVWGVKIFEGRVGLVYIYRGDRVEIKVERMFFLSWVV